jgi:hypothetical protein
MRRQTDPSNPSTLPMFVSAPEYAFHLPAGLAEPGTQCWRAVGLTVHQPWFLATIVMGAGEDGYLRSICVAWDTDLVQMIEAPDGATLAGLACMMPGWMSSSGRWQSREISAIWRARDEQGNSVLVFRDTEGGEFLGSGEPPGHVVDRALIYQSEREQPSE